jgi:hypothetical protein
MFYVRDGFAQTPASSGLLCLHVGSGPWVSVWLQLPGCIIYITPSLCPLQVVESGILDKLSTEERKRQEVRCWAGGTEQRVLAKVPPPQTSRGPYSTLEEGDRNQSDVHPLTHPLAASWVRCGHDD